MNRNQSIYKTGSRNDETSMLLELRGCSMADCSLIHMCNSSGGYQYTRGEANDRWDGFLHFMVSLNSTYHVTEHRDAHIS